MEKNRKVVTSRETENDFVGNNAAFTCPLCSKVFIVSGLLHKGKRVCPKCGNATGYVNGGSKSGGEAYVEF